MSVGFYIKHFRKRAKLTQVQLAAKANLSRSYIADIERDRYNPSVDTLKNIAAALDIPLRNLILEDDERVSQEKFDILLRNLSTDTKFFKDSRFREDARPLLQEVLVPFLVDNEVESEGELTFDKELTPYNLSNIFKEIEDDNFRIEMYNLVNLVRLQLEQNSHASKLNELNSKDEKDIAKELEKLIEGVNEGSFAAFDGQTVDELDEEDRELLILSLENSLRFAKRIAKKKFTPKKYKNEE